MVPTAKRALSFEQIDAQTAVELPDRDMMALINIIVFDVLNDVNVNVQVPVGVAANVCGVSVAVIVEEAENGPVDCTATADIHDIPVQFR
jgi:hypothetical protein